MMSCCIYKDKDYDLQVIDTPASPYACDDIDDDSRARGVDGDAKSPTKSTSNNGTGNTNCRNSDSSTSDKKLSGNDTNPNPLGRPMGPKERTSASSMSEATGKWRHVKLDESSLPFSASACLRGDTEEVYRRRGYCVVYLRLWHAKDLPAADVSGFSDPYLRISSARGEICRTKTVAMNCDPVWHEEITFSMHHPQSAIKLEVFDADLIGADELLGDVILQLAHMRNGEPVRGWFHLEAGAEFEHYVSRSHLLEGYCGRIYLEIVATYNPGQERALRFIPAPAPLSHMGHFDIDDLFAKVMRIKEIAAEGGVVVPYITSLMEWDDKLVSGTALSVFVLHWWYSFLLLPSILVSLVSAHMWLGTLNTGDLRRKSSIVRANSYKSNEEVAQYVKGGVADGVGSILGGVSTIHTDMVEAMEHRDVIGTGKGAIVGVGGAATGAIEGTATMTTTALRGVGGALGSHVSTRPKAKNALEGAVGAGAEVFDGVDRGFKALVRNPLQGARQGGTLGLIKGLGAGVLEAGQGVTGGVINAVATGVEGVAATPGALLDTVGLAKNRDDEEKECATMGVWARFASGFLPSETKKSIGDQQRTLYDVVLLAEKILCAITWRKPSAARLIDGVLIGVLTVALLFPWVAAASSTFLPDVDVAAMIPSFNTVCSTLFLLSGFVFFTCRTPILGHVLRIINGVIAILTNGAKPGLTKHGQFDAEDRLPVSIMQFRPKGDPAIALDEWLDK